VTEFASRFAVERPDEMALRDERQALRWSEVDDAINRVANALREADLGPDRRIAVFAENAAEIVLVHLGGLIGGASVVPVSFHLTPDEVAYVLEDSGTRMLFVGPETAARGLTAAAGGDVHTVVGWADEPGVLPWSEWLGSQSADEPPTDLRPLPNLLYTSGTTGRPKGTELPPTMFSGSGSVREHLATLAHNPMQDLGAHLVVGPMYHTGPLTGVRLLVSGIPIAIQGRFDAEKTLRAIHEYGIGSTVMVPTHFVRLLALPDSVKAQYDVSSMKQVSHSGAKCPDEVKRAMIEWWGPIFVEIYGASEVGGTCVINSQEWLEHPGSVGKSMPPFEVVVLDEDGNELAAGEEGRLYFRDSTGRGVVYHNDPEKSAAAHVAPGVFTLGEIGRVDEEGYVYITDRFSDMIVSGGVNIYPAESEHVLIDHPAVLDVACIGVPHPEMGEELKALAVPSEGIQPPDPQEVIDWCRSRLSHYKCPVTLEWVADIGRTGMGKVNKRKLREPYWRTEA